MDNKGQDIITLTEGIARNPVIRFNEPVNLTFSLGEHLAIVGPNGSGKSVITDMLLGKYPLLSGKLTYDFSPADSQAIYKNVKYITFRDSYGDYDAHYYYQQRFNSQDQEDAPAVRTLLGDIQDEALKEELFDLFELRPLLDKKIILLSSGELRKFQLTKALLSAPGVLIMDNPFIGLDVSARELLHTLLEKLSQRKALQIILLLSLLDDIPEFITNVLPVKDNSCGLKVTREEYMESYIFSMDEDELIRIQAKVRNLPQSETRNQNEEVVRLNAVSIRYGERTILKDLDWIINKGEKWALSGRNGSGKSTLLSLICADNPQSYACDISLFGRKRGTGESIWEIKKHIGYVSPEMHRAYMKNIPAIEIVGSGLHDSIGLYKRLPEEFLEVCEWWMDVFGVAHLKDTPFLQLSSGEQRLCLLARAFVKDPELLILDEPLHGLDTYNRVKVKAIINAYCQRKDKTVIMVTHYEEELPSSIDKRLFLTKNQ